MIRQNEKGAALIVVLIVVITVTVLSLGFLSKADGELASSVNLSLRSQMDAIAFSGLEHAKVLLSNPQTVDTSVTDYWQGGTGLQIESSSDYYDLAVSRNASAASYEYLYDVYCQAYRNKNGEKIGRSGLNARLRLHPVIAYWQDLAQSIPDLMTVNGSTYIQSSADIYGTINGDVYASGQISGTGTVTGTKNEYSSAPLALPGISCSDFQMSYYYNGGGPYTVKQLANSYAGTFASPGSNNPAKVYYCSGDLALEDIVGTIEGTVIVTSNFRLQQGCSVTISPVKNMPGLVIGYELHVPNPSQSLTVNGFSQIQNHIDMLGKSDVSLRFEGALYILGDGVRNAAGLNSKVIVNANPGLAALQIWHDSSAYSLWSPVGGAICESITRPSP